MERKLVIQGAGAYTLSLPVQWIRKQQLKEGDIVHLEEQEGKILISGVGKSQNKEIEIQINEDKEKRIRIQIQGLYRLGYDTIHILYKTKKQKEIIERICSQYLLGFEITREDNKKNYCMIENVTEPSAEKQEVLLRRMFRILIQSMQIMQEEIQENRITKIKEIEQWTEKLDQYDNFCRRNISKRRFSEEGITLYWTLYTQLHLMQRNILHLHKQCQEIKLTSQTKQDVSIIVKHLTTSIEDFDCAFYESTVDKLNILVEKNDILLYEKILPQLKKEGKNAGILFHYLAEFTRLLTVALSPAIALQYKHQREQK